MNLIKLFGILSLVIFFVSCKKEDIINPDVVSEFINEQKILITGYSSDAMEPFISKDGNYLFFNNLQGVNGKDLYYAERVDDTTFEFKGEIQGVNSVDVDGNPTMDGQNNFYFISTRDLDTGMKTIYSGAFNNVTVLIISEVKLSQSGICPNT